VQIARRVCQVETGRAGFRGLALTEAYAKSGQMAAERFDDLSEWQPIAGGNVVGAARQSRGCLGGGKHTRNGILDV
jgi:hypothetical protein